jgi:thioesterase domain-containing protein
VVAFEMAQQLRRQGENVTLLILLDALLPGIKLSNKLADRISIHKKRIAGMPVWKKIAYIAARAVQRGRWEIAKRFINVRPLIERMMFEFLERNQRPVPPYLRQRRLLQLNGVLNEDYKPQPYKGRTVLIRGVYPNLQYDIDFGWNSVIEPEVQIYQMEVDDHLQMMIEPEKLALLIQNLRHALRD